MTRTASAKPKAFRRARLRLALVIALSAGSTVGLFMAVDPRGQAFELQVSDEFRPAAALPAETPPNESVPITLVLIDDAALEQFGHWPWPWTRLAEAIDTLVDLRARLIVLDIEFPEPDRPEVVRTVLPDGSVREEIVQTVPRLVESVRLAGNVLIPFSLHFQDAGTGRAEGARPPGAPGQAEAEAAERERVPPILARHARPLASGPAPDLLRAAGYTPMIEPLGEVCAGSGFTSYPAPDPGGVVRRVPMLVRGEVMFPHLMLAAAAHWQFGPRYAVRLGEGRLVISAEDGRRSVGVPVDEQAQLELRWPSRPEAVAAMPIARLLELAQARRRYAALMATLDGLFPEEGWAAARRALDDARRRRAEGGDGGPTDDDLRGLEDRLAATEERLAMNLLMAAPEPGAPEPTDEKGRRLAALAAEHLDFLRSYEVATSDAESPVARVRRMVEGRLCLLGTSATAVVGLDLHTTPLGPKQPGVTLYPSGIRTILSGVAFQHFDRWHQFLITLACAVLAGVLTVRMPTFWGVTSTVLLSAAILGTAWMMAARAALLMPVAGPVLGVVVAFAGVSGYRQLTEASSRRWITGVFQQYTSAEHVEEILRDPESLRLGGARRDITFLFSDIAGFTTLSEQYEPERLVALLNHYLSAMTEVLLAERATLDKYEGDAILAFFGAPMPLADHALRAVRSALAMQAALPRVNEELIQTGLLPEGTRLAMRIGCSSGPAIVGNFGSERRFDYTAMGDTVNLGSRMEEANRWLRSRILVPEPTRAGCAEAVLFRKFGPARIRGKAQPVNVYEPLALEPADPSMRQRAEMFAQVIDALAARDVEAAGQALARLSAAAPDDGPAQVLQARLDAVRAGQAAPGEPWNLAQPK